MHTGRYVAPAVLHTGHIFTSDTWTETQYFNFKNTDLIISFVPSSSVMFETLQICALFASLRGIVTSQRGQILNISDHKNEFSTQTFIRVQIFAIPKHYFLKPYKFGSFFDPLWGLVASKKGQILNISKY